MFETTGVVAHGRPTTQQSHTKSHAIREVSPEVLPLDLSSNVSTASSTSRTRILTLMQGVYLVSEVSSFSSPSNPPKAAPLGAPVTGETTALVRKRRFNAWT